MNRIESECMRILDRFRVAPSIETGKRCMAELTEAIGPGFHPDTPFREYVDENRSPVFESSRSEALDRSLADVMAFLYDHDVDPHDEAGTVQRRLLGLTALID